jgi:hypothetical protein
VSARERMLVNVTISAQEATDVLHVDLPCVKCAYNLRGLTRDGRCPECGESIHVSVDARSAQSLLIARWRHRCIIGAVFTLLPIAIAYLGLWIGFRNDLFGVAMQLILLTPPLLVWLGVRWIATHEFPWPVLRGGRRLLHACTTATVLLILVPEAAEELMRKRDIPDAMKQTMRVICPIAGTALGLLATMLLYRQLAVTARELRLPVLRVHARGMANLVLIPVAMLSWSLWYNEEPWVPTRWLPGVGWVQLFVLLAEELLQEITQLRVREWWQLPYAVAGIITFSWPILHGLLMAQVIWRLAKFRGSTARS